MGNWVHRLADMLRRSIAFKWINQSRETLDTEYAQLIKGNGSYKDGGRNTNLAIYSNSVETGEWVDYRLIEMSEQEVSTLADHLYQLLSISLINFAWRQQYVYIACYPMGRDVCTRTPISRAPTPGSSLTRTV